MALKFKIDKKAFDKLSKDLQVEYTEKDGEYTLDVSGASDDTSALVRAKDRAVQERKDAEQKARDAQAKLDELDNNDARKKGDIEKLEKSWKEKDAAKDVAHAEALAKKDKFISHTLVDAKAASIAAEISTSPTIILPHIKARLMADLEGDDPTTKILDKDGKASVMTVDDLKKEFVDNKDFAGIITGSKASGGAADKGQKMRLGGASQNDEDKPPILSDISGKDLAAAIKANKEAD